jgi:protein SCO1/2
MKLIRLVSFASAVALATAGCGTDQQVLVGLVRDNPLKVATVSLPEEFWGRTTTPFTMRAKPDELLVVYFGYTMCPDLCPTTLADLRSALKRIGPSSDIVDLAFVTVDPLRDTVDRLAPYLSSYVERFHVLRTTDMVELKNAEEAFLANSTVTTNAAGVIEVTHTALAYIVDDMGTVIDELPFGVGADGFTNDLQILINNTNKGE